MECINEKLSIKNLLFTKAIPNYVIPISTDGHKLFTCIDCGDKFILESSYEYHINRQSVQISYRCRHCGESLVFFNRCNLLYHIRSHTFKTATINVSDLKIEPLPLSYFKLNRANSTSDSTNTNTSVGDVSNRQKTQKSMCFECKEDVTDIGVLYKDRAKHYMKYTNVVYTCPVCLFAVPTSCGFKAHLRIHLRCPPYYCPECGCHLPNKAVIYPHNHDCEGFRMMRVTARIKCPVDGLLFHPNEYKDHFKNQHLKTVFKCPFCYVACFSSHIMNKHLKTHTVLGKASIYFQCELCPGRLVLQTQLEYHMKSHVNSIVYPCWTCLIEFKDTPSFIDHHLLDHNQPNNMLKEAYDAILKNTEKVYRVVKKCDQCKRSFTYKCNFEQIRLLPNDCPYNCSSDTSQKDSQQSVSIDEEVQVTCHMCKNKMPYNWNDIKSHYAIHHKAYRCLDIKLSIEKFDVDKYFLEKRPKKLKNINNKKKIAKRSNNKAKKDNKTGTISNETVQMLDTNQFWCKKCDFQTDNKQDLESHLTTHRDPCMAYQCMECGECFVVKPSFAKHLLLKHQIADSEEYITNNSCFNESALTEYQCRSVNDEPLRENQCNICRDQFESTEDLEKHFRVHGMAFLMKNNSTKNSSP